MASASVDTVVGFEAAKLPPYIDGVGIPGSTEDHLFVLQAPLIRLDIDGEIIEQPCILVSMMNGRRMGVLSCLRRVRSDDGIWKPVYCRAGDPLASYRFVPAGHVGDA